MTTASPFGFAFDHVQLAIASGTEDACRRFYVDVMGFTEVPKPPVLAARGGLWLRADGIEVHLGVEAEFRPARKAHPAFAVRELDALVKALSDAGVAVTWDASIPGTRRCFVDDNSGNRLELVARTG